MSGQFNQDYIFTTEKRRPSVWPTFPEKLKITKEYLTAVDAYLDDHFGFRSRLINFNNLIRYRLRSSGSEQVIIGKKNWLFYNSEGLVDQYRGIQLFSGDDLKQWVVSMEARRDWLREQNVEFAVAIAPNKMTMYPEYLPDWVSKIKPTTQLDQVAEEIKNNSSLLFVDLRQDLKDAKMKYPLYYQTDSHWNFHGGYVGYRAIMQRLVKVFPGITPVSEEDAHLTFVPGKGKDLAALLNVAGDIVEPYDDRTVLSEQAEVVSRTDLAEDGSLFVVKTKLSHAPRAMIFRDSFTDLLIPYFNATFSEIVYVKNDNDHFDQELVEKFNPDIVLHIIVERGLKYIPYNVNSSAMYIKNWGPRRSRLGEGFNLLPTGDSSLWVKSDKITPQAAIFWNGTRLNTTVLVDKGVATAIVPGSLFDEEAEYPVYMYDASTQVKSNTVMFQVYR